MQWVPLPKGNHVQKILGRCFEWSPMKLEIQAINSSNWDMAINLKANFYFSKRKNNAFRINEFCLSIVHRHHTHTHRGNKVVNQMLLAFFI